jgi:hypothetical protein
MSYYASMLAMNPAVHRSVALNGRHYLEERLSNAEECWAGWHTVLADHGKHARVRQNHGEITPDSLQPLPPGKIFDPAPRTEAEPAG